MNYCCSKMKWADEKGIIDYIPGHLTTIDVGRHCYPINFCPFCGTELRGTKKSVRRIRKYFGKREGGSESMGKDKCLAHTRQAKREAEKSTKMRG